ncbi:MAG: glycogen synthase [Bdellovibrionaceae bacterium]|nr:glycogen synthase [Pseudobdellovibrionaceae bacterium]
MSARRVRASAPRVLMVSPEQTGVLQTGGLSHATAGLTESLNREGVRTEVLMPFFLEMQANKPTATGETINVGLDFRGSDFPHKTSVFTVHRGGSETNPTTFLRHETAQQNYFDNRTNGNGAKFYAPEAHIGESFGAFAKAAAEYILTRNFDVVILNDWTTGLIAVHLEEARRAGVKVPKVVFAIHNIAYQGLFPKSLADFLGLSERHFNAARGYEFWGQMNFLKAGLQYADMIYTVSKQYAKEIATERFGAGLDGVIRQKMTEGRVTGILNGILDHEWDPKRTKRGLVHRFSMNDFSGKALGKADMQAELGLPVRGQSPIFILTSRLAEQKGFEYLVDAIHKTAAQADAQWIIIGNGDAKYVDSLKSLEAQFPDRVRYRAFTNHLEAQLTRYGDFFVNGAWFEPSGLNQFFALKNGTIPVVSEAGGLADSVKPGVNGLRFPIIPKADGTGYEVDATSESARRAFQEAIDLYQDAERLEQMRRVGMSENNSWTGRIRAEFFDLFKRLGGRQGFGAAKKCVSAHGSN